MSQTLTESPQRSIKDSFIKPQVQKHVYDISNDCKDNVLLNQILTANKESLDHRSLIKHDEQIECATSLNVFEPPPLIKIDLNNNSYKDWDCVFAQNEKAARKDSLTVYQPDLQEPKFSTDGHVTVFGSDAGDIPTSYSIPALAQHEMVAVGTFVDPLITPGYPYRVRLNGSDDFLFEGKPLILKTVGQGYGKRLTFEANDILNNTNYFWSDSNPPDGFALSLALKISGDFVVKTNDEQEIGWSTVDSVNGPQVIKRVRCSPSGAVELEVSVKMTCTIVVQDRKNLQSNMSAEDVEGVAIVTKTKHYLDVHRIENIKVAGWGECFLVKK